jgi:hypothetical protein
MPNTAQDFLSFAKAISATSSSVDEISQRVVINRGYYSIYHLARDIAEKMSLPEAKNNKTGSHQKLFNRLIEADKRPASELITLKSIGYLASHTKHFRVKADYKINDLLPKDAVAQTLANAQKVFDKARLLPL